MREAVTRQEAPLIGRIRGPAKQQRFRAPDEVFALDARQAQVNPLHQVLGPVTDPLRQIALEVAIVTVNDPLEPCVFGRLGH